MDLSQVQKNQKVKISSVNAHVVLKKRLASLGVIVGKEVEVLESTLQNNTLKIGIAQGFVAIRLDEAKHIEVEAIHA